MTQEQIRAWLEWAVKQEVIKTATAMNGDEKGDVYYEANLEGKNLFVAFPENGVIKLHSFFLEPAIRQEIKARGWAYQLTIRPKKSAAKIEWGSILDGEETFCLDREPLHALMEAYRMAVEVSSQ